MPKATQKCRLEKSILKGAINRHIKDFKDIKLPDVPNSITPPVDTTVKQRYYNLHQRFLSDQNQLKNTIDSMDVKKGLLLNTYYSGQEFVENAGLELAKQHGALIRMVAEQRTQLNDDFDRLISQAGNDTVQIDQLKEQQKTANKLFDDALKLYQDKSREMLNEFVEKNNELKRWARDPDYAHIMLRLKEQNDKGEDELSFNELAALREKEPKLDKIVVQKMTAGNFNDEKNKGPTMDNDRNVSMPVYLLGKNRHQNIINIRSMYQGPDEEGRFKAPESFNIDKSYLDYYKGAYPSSFMETWGKKGSSFNDALFAFLVSLWYVKPALDEMNKELAYNDRQAQLSNDDNVRALMQKAAENLPKDATSKQLEDFLKENGYQSPAPPAYNKHGIPPEDCSWVVHERAIASHKESVKENDPIILMNLFQNQKLILSKSKKNENAIEISGQNPKNPPQNETPQIGVRPGSRNTA